MWILSLAEHIFSYPISQHRFSTPTHRSNSKVVLLVQYQMEQELPWTRWIIPLGHPVGLRTKLGILLTGDDGNIYIACANNKAYAIEVSIKPGCLEDIISRTPTKEF